MAEREVELDLCTRGPDGEIECEDDGYDFTYETGTVGPTEGSVTYP